MSYIAWVSWVYSTSQTHFLSRCFQSFSSGRYLRSGAFFLAWVRKSSTVRPSICGTAATLTADLFMYYWVRINKLSSFVPLVIYLRKNMFTVSSFGRYASHSWVRKLKTSFLDEIFSISWWMLTCSSLADCCCCIVAFCPYILYYYLIDYSCYLMYLTLVLLKCQWNVILLGALHNQKITYCRGLTCWYLVLLYCWCKILMTRPQGHPYTLEHQLLMTIGKRMIRCC